MIEKNINQLPKKSLWSYFVAEKSFLADNFLEIIDYRDCVMHARNMSYKYFCKIMFAIEEANREIDLLIVQYVNQTKYLTTPLQKTLNTIIKRMLKN